MEKTTLDKISGDTIVPGVDLGGYIYSGCSHRLPCGLCRLTMAPCPKAGGNADPYRPTVIWSSSETVSNVMDTINTNAKGE